MKLPIAQVWVFASESSDRRYETLQYTDGSTSCNCPGWTRRIDARGQRSCKHTRLVDMRRADSECLDHTDYRSAAGSERPAAAFTQAVVPGRAPIAIGQRKLILSERSNLSHDHPTH